MIIRKTVYKDGNTYTNVYYIWLYEGKMHAIRLTTCFAKEFRQLYAIAEEVLPNESFKDCYKRLALNRGK